MPSETVIALRKQLREKFPAAHREEQGRSRPVASPQPAEAPTSPTSLSSLARRATEGHFPLNCPSEPWPSGCTRHYLPGAITEISPAAPSCGLSLIVAALLSQEEADEPRLPLVLIDTRDRFDPASFSSDECARLLWLRCQNSTQALRAADLLLRDGNLPLVLLDLSSLPARELRRIPSASWHRLRQLAESTDAALLALTPTPLIPRTALRLTLTRQFTLDDLHLSRPELLATLQTQTTRHLHQTA
ncbi:hypothetical protein ACFQY0_16610 [Haloferula chungangensis]|uniref:DNA recombination and repair protein Rad51-like C-terminal domain-containing protein n=1 Tax=Haloferula chungangensis TaxID=1048331 RepID=A0ABW2LCB8_9BACT